MTPMQRALVTFATGAALALTAAAPLAQQRFQSGVELIVVPVSVTSGGRAVTDLTTKDFALTDNGVAQTIDAVSLDTMPIDVSLVLDASFSVRGAMLERLKRAVSDTSAMLTSRDRLRLISVQHVIREVFPWQAGGTTPPVDNLMAGGSTSLFDAVAAALMRSSAPDRRHLIVIFTDGMDTSSVVSPAATQQIASASDAVVHAVVVIEDLEALRSRQPSSAGTVNSRGGSVRSGLTAADEQQLPVLRPIRDAAVTPTGGQVFPMDAQSKISDAFGAAIRAFRQSYVLRYSPQAVPPDGWHSIAVSVTRSGRYEIRARKGYGS